MRRREIEEFLEHNQVAYDPKETVAELKARGLKLFPKVPHDETRGITSWNKQRLVLKALDLGIEIGDPKEWNRGDLLLEIRAALKSPTVMGAMSLMSFGKYRNETFEEVLQNHEEYVDWCEVTARTGEACAEMKVFLTWVREERARARDETSGEEERPTSRRTTTKGDEPMTRRRSRPCPKASTVSSGSGALKAPTANGSEHS